jgi:DNA-binding transcriptional regulator YiaG
MRSGTMTPFSVQTQSMPNTLKKLERDIMAHKWRDIRRELSPELEEETRDYVRSLVAAVTLNQLREARNLTQANLAIILGVNQGSVSKMEKRADMYVSTLRSFIQAMGGQLQIKAVFPEGEVQIEQFESVAVSPQNSRQETAA